MMKAYVLRAKCEIDSSVQTPEYADNLLLVEFTCHTPLIGVSELTVRAYSSDLQLIASDTVSVANRKKHPEKYASASVTQRNGTTDKVTFTFSATDIPSGSFRLKPR